MFRSRQEAYFACANQVWLAVDSQLNCHYWRMNYGLNSISGANELNQLPLIILLFMGFQKVAEME